MCVCVSLSLSLLAIVHTFTKQPPSSIPPLPPTTPSSHNFSSHNLLH